MRYMGIDFGKKRVGVAISDESGRFALPLAVVPNNKGLFEALKKIVTEKAVEAVILGESKDFQGKDNNVMLAIHDFKKKFEFEAGLTVFFEPEFMTSAEANRMNMQEPVQSRRSGLSFRRPRVSNGMLDASAAALILKSYLDKQTKHD